MNALLPPVSPHEGVVSQNGFQPVGSLVGRKEFPPLKSCILQLSTVYDREIPTLSLYFIHQLTPQVFSEPYCVPCTVLGTRNVMVNELGKVPVFICSEFGPC